MKVATITRTTIQKRVAVTKTSKDYGEYLAALSQITDDQGITVQPDNGDSMRKLKLNFARASKLANIKIAYGESKDGKELLVWLNTDPPKEKRSRNRKNGAVDSLHNANEGAEAAG